MHNINLKKAYRIPSLHEVHKSFKGKNYRVPSIKKALFGAFFVRLTIKLGRSKNVVCTTDVRKMCPFRVEGNVRLTQSSEGNIYMPEEIARRGAPEEKQTSFCKLCLAK